MTTIERDLLSLIAKITAYSAQLPKDTSGGIGVLADSHIGGEMECRNQLEAILQEASFCICPLPNCRGSSCTRETHIEHMIDPGGETVPCQGKYHNTDSSAKMLICSDCEGR
jgi:hypothetical protein